MKKLLLLTAIFCFALTGCAKQGTPVPSKDGNVSEETSGDEISGENTTENETTGSESEENEMTTVYEPVPYRLFPVSKDAWVGDVMPVADENGMYLYYLYDTDHNGVGYHPIWRFSTQNFYDYTDDGLMVNFGASTEEPDLAVGTGSVLQAQDGSWHCFYTGHNDQFPEQGKDKECVMHAVSEDGKEWTKVPEDTFYAEDNYSGDDFRDPFVFWNEEENCYWLLIAAREQELGGVVAKYTSTDLKTWTIDEPLYAPNKQYMLECPDLFYMNGHYYLFYSWDCVTYYAMSDSINGPFVAPENNVLDGTGFCFYAAKTAEYKGNRYLCGWVGRKREPKDSGAYDWAGNLLIHQLVQKEDGTLGVKPIDSLTEYFKTPQEVTVTGQTGEVTQEEGTLRLASGKKEIAVADLGVRPATMLLDCTVTFDREGYAGLAFGEGDNYNKYTGLVLDAKNQCIHYEGSVLERMPYVDPLITTDFHFETGKEYRVRLVAENEIMVLYVDDTKALSTRIYKSVDGAHIGFFTNNAEVTISDISMTTP